MYLHRQLEEQVLKASRTTPIVMVCGQRQVGKSTMLYHLKDADRTYVTLDDINARRLAENDPALFFETYPAPLLIDEFQRVPSIALEMKRIVDERTLRGENAAGMYWLTGSQKFTLMQNASETLAGRVAIFEMSSLSEAEIDGRAAAAFSPKIEDLRRARANAQPKTIAEIYQAIYRGGMPRIVTGEAEPERYYADYVSTYLEKDIRGFAGIGKMREFSDFLIYMAAHTAQELVYSRIASDIGASAATAKEWVSILEQSGVIYLLRPYYNNITKRLVKTPKVYFLDTGLAAYLCRWPNAETLQNGAMDGAFFETWAVSEIVKSEYNAGKQPNLWYYRDSDKKEIDLLMVEGTDCYPIEIKKSANPSDADRHFDVVSRLNLTAQPGLIICAASELIPYSRKAWLCPAWLI